MSKDTVCPHEAALREMIDEIGCDYLAIGHLTKRASHDETAYLSCQVGSLAEAIAAAYRRGLEAAGAKPERVAPKYKMDFSQAREWPTDLNKDMEESCASQGYFSVDSDELEYELSLPWYYDLAIEGSALVITGYATKGHEGSSETRIDKSQADGLGLYTFYVKPQKGKEEVFLEVMHSYEKYGVRFTPVEG